MDEFSKIRQSRGYQKIAGAAQVFGFDFRGKVVLDIGSSTGGFTAYALERGAKKVIAVEKGTRQMDPWVRANPRVDLHEKTDIFAVRASTGAEINTGGSGMSAEIGTDAAAKPALTIESPDVILADVSNLSLTKVLKYAKMNLARRDTDYLVMCKPQFEARPGQLNKGVVKNSKIRREILADFEQTVAGQGFRAVKKRDNQVAGRAGNVERFYWLVIAEG